MLAGVILAGIIIGIIVTVFRRTSAMSDELSKQSKARFEALKPASTSPDSPQVPRVMERPQPSVRADRVQDAGGYLALRKDLLETKFQLEQYIREKTPLVEKQRETLAEVSKLKTEVLGLRDRLNVEGQEIQKLKSSLGEQNVKLQSQRRDIEIQRIETDKVREQPKFENLMEEISELRDRLLTTEQELQKLRTTLEDHATNLQQAPVLQMPPPVQATPTGLPETPPPLVPKTCANCGYTVEAEDRYCFHCGRPVLETPKSPR